MVVLVLQLTLVTYVNVHFLIREAIVKLLFQQSLLDQLVLVLFVHVLCQQQTLSIHVCDLNKSLQNIIIQ